MMHRHGKVSPMWRGFFWAACLFNLLIGIGAMLSPEASVDARIVGVLVLGFGVVYLQVARDPMRFAPVLWAGVLGKLGVVGLLGPAALGEDGSAVVAAILAGDLLFALGFLAFLFTAGESARN
ncbi:MAG: hypothetical protein A3J40_01625 [Erythrobacter sp. RIFCSPHIGHO2_12_FULL_63_10]|nr:MAG: hypothetical protein A3J40_01625 [Erythrobacter sp. RIFCSPHIGHO2_12_FULL_63_10]